MPWYHRWYYILLRVRYGPLCPRCGVKTDSMVLRYWQMCWDCACAAIRHARQQHVARLEQERTPKRLLEV